jgi:AhpC/TSA family
MSATIIYDDRPATTVASATAEGDNLWLSTADLTRATGWEIKPQSACLGDRCVPLPVNRTAEFVRPGDRFNLTALAKQIDQPFAVDERHAVWSFASAPDIIGTKLRSLEAPDFTLPDLDGKLHSLSDYRGRKVMLMSWASW